jgi:hypothetical protein
MAFVDANNWVDVYWSAANTVTLRTRVGGVENTNNWDATGLIAAGTTYMGEVIYTAASARLIVDNVTATTVTTAIDLGGSPVTIYWGSDNNEANQSDMVVAPPTP